MAGKPGRSGTNKGQDRPWKDALLLAVKEATDDDDKTKLRKLAKKLVEKAMDGDVQALKEIGDRLDGKPRQEVEASGPDGAPLITRLEIVAANVNRKG